MAARACGTDLTSRLPVDWYADIQVAWSNMKARIFTILFASPFFGVGVWMLWAVANDFNDAWQMRSWQPTQARLIQAGYNSKSGDNSTTYEAYAQYTYQFRGQEFTNDRVAIAGGADNIGEYQRDMGRKLSSAFSRREPITVFVDPDNPRDAIIDPTLRWGLIGFKSVFLFVFGGVGLGLIIFAVRSPKKKDTADPAYQTEPWKLNDKWQTASVRSSSKQTMYFTWGFAAFWNLVSAPLPFLMYREILEKQNYAALLGILFPLIGIGLIVWAVRSTLEWKRFGPAPVALDPFPGAIGGHVGGTIDVNLPFDAGTKIMLTLTNLHSYISGSGKNRSRSEKAKWQDKQIAHSESGPNGTRLSFRFGVPEGLTESDADQSCDDYHIWRLNLQADLPGTDIDRDYEIPVYPTGERSHHISARAVESARSETDQMDDLAVRDAIELSTSFGGKEMYFPMGRNLGSALGGLVFGGTFTGAGWWLMFPEGRFFFGLVFGAVGLAILLFSLYAGLNSLQIIKDATELSSVRRILGIPVKRSRMRCTELVRFSKDSSYKTQSGKKHVVHYSIYAEDSRGQKMVVGEGFKGDSQANAAIRFLTRELGLRPREDLASARSDQQFDFLAADN